MADHQSLSIFKLAPVETSLILAEAASLNMRRQNTKSYEEQDDIDLSEEDLLQRCKSGAKSDQSISYFDSSVDEFDKVHSSWVNIDTELHQRGKAHEFYFQIRVMVVFLVSGTVFIAFLIRLCFVTQVGFIIKPINV